MRVLIIEDNADIADCIQHSLSDMGIASDWFARGGLLKEAFRSAEYDLVILDLNLPDIDGLKALKAFRSTDQLTPVLIVSARISIDERVKGLDLGADDYLIKPFDLQELEARVRALLRRQGESRGPNIEFDALSFDQTTREFELDGEELNLTPRERSVLEILIRQGGDVISKARIADHVFNFDDEAGTSSIQLYVHRIRKKLTSSSITIATRRGLGYALQLVQDSD